MAVLRRLTFKQKVEAVSPRKPSQEMETSELSSFPSQSQQGHSPKEHTKKTSKKTRATQLKRAKLLGLVDKALKPFAIFCKEKKLQAKMASPLWKEMSPQEKDLYVKKSKETFENKGHKVQPWELISEDHSYTPYYLLKVFLTKAARRRRRIVTKESKQNMTWCWPTSTLSNRRLCGVPELMALSMLFPINGLKSCMPAKWKLWGSLWATKSKCCVR